MNTTNSPEVKSLIESFPEEDRDAVSWHMQFEILRELRSIVARENGSVSSVNKTWKKRYQEYIKSDVWKNRTDIMKRKFGNRCQVCNQSEKDITLHVHHRTYERLGLELPEDLTLLCKNCHLHHHREMEV